MEAAGKNRSAGHLIRPEKNPITVLMGRSHIPKSGKLRIATVWEQLYLTSGVFNENFFPNAKSHNVLDISKTVMKKELF